MTHAVLLHRMPDVLLQTEVAGVACGQHDCQVHTGAAVACLLQSSATDGAGKCWDCFLH